MKLTPIALILAACVGRPADRARLAIALDEPWPAHTIAAGPGGADGVALADADGDGDLDVATAWEQGSRATVSLNPGQGVAATPWPTVVVASGALLQGAEDAAWGDLDLDGRLDVAIACESGKRLLVAFAPPPEHLLEPGAWVITAIVSSLNVQRWMRVAVADLDADGRPDLLAGGKVSPATVGWLRGPAAPRDPGAWTYAALGAAAWVMSLEAWDADGDGDLDVLLADRTYQTLPGGGRDYSLMGSRWLEAGAGWASHPIGAVAGDAKMLRRADLDGDGIDEVIDGRSSPTLGNLLKIKARAPGGTWNATAIPAPTGVGLYQHAAAGDLDGDGAIDLVLSHAEAPGDLSGVVWLRAPAWDRGEIAGQAGAKYDNVELADLDADGDLDVVTSEQADELGVLWYENPSAPAIAIDAGAIDAPAGCDAAAVSA